MKIKNQLNKIKENWLLVLLFVVLVVVIPTLVSPDSPNHSLDYHVSAQESYASEPLVLRDGLAAEENRKITTVARLSLEIRRNTFGQKKLDVKDKIKSTNALILNENENVFGVGKNSRHQISYTIKVSNNNYNSLIETLKEIGEIKNFNENKNDITERYLTVEKEIKVEKQRLQRYQELFNGQLSSQEKIDLVDRIFNQERRIEHLEEILKNEDLRVEYNTIYFTMTEASSKYESIVFTTFSELIRSLVNSINNLLRWLFMLIPYLLIAGLGWLIYNKIKK